MDQVSKRYSDPCFFMDGMIQTCRFSEFVSEFIQTINQEREDQLDWEFFLHKVWEGTFQEFKDGIKANRENQSMSKRTIETTVKNSMDILKNFNPNTGGEVIDGTV